jgi:acyl-CoA reductase-like NAD-dependent aldehyde dehydrogenase
MQNNGASCIAAKRFIVEEPVLQAFTEQFVARVEDLKVGNPLRPETDIGPIAREDLLTEIHDQVTRAITQGARLCLGGERLERPGFYYMPTVLSDVEPGTVPFEEEIFGPVAAITRARDAAHAVELANHTPFGLGAAVFTQDVTRGEAIALQLEAGCTFVNGMVKSDPRLPFGGVKASGYGRELSHFGLREFVNIKSVWIG